MQFLSVLSFVGVASAAVPQFMARAESDMALARLQNRQVTICKAVAPPVTCERSCGPGYVKCVTDTNCYNPGNGESCCSNGKYCPAGYYCSDVGCCPNDVSLAECGATRTLSIILPPVVESTSAAGSSAAETSAPKPTSTVYPDTTVEVTTGPEPTATVYPDTTVEETTEASTTNLPATTSKPPIVPNNSTAVAPTTAATTPVPVPTAGASRSGEYALVAVLGAVGAAVLGLY